MFRETATYVARIDSLEESTFRERLRLAHAAERDDLVRVVESLEGQYHLRRAELS